GAPGRPAPGQPQHSRRPACRRLHGASAMNDAVRSTPVPYAEARAILERVARARRLPADTIALARAHGRVLASGIEARIAVPGFDNSAMDGFALRHADLAAGDGWLALRGEQFAGGPAPAAPGAGGCVRITTGAPMPEGTDTVLIKEDAEMVDGRVRALAEPGPGRHVGRRRGWRCLPPRVSRPSRSCGRRRWRCSAPATSWWSRACRSGPARSTTPTASC